MKKAKFPKPGILAGEIYEDCLHHPMLCLEANPQLVTGISLFDGSGPKSCSTHRCRPRKMRPAEVAVRIQNRERWVKAQGPYSADLGQGDLVRRLAAEEAAQVQALEAEGE
jgi:hypothetical protein